jgi:DNA-directed RNA polymerase subunit RPC12/RpoP
MSEKCTRCKKELDDFKIDLSFKIKVDRMKENSIWEYIPNLDQVSREVLCQDCFLKFSDLMAQLNIKHEKSEKE